MQVTKLLVKFYQVFLGAFFGGQCRFQPTCSHYCLECLETHGVFQGLYLTLKRISKCHPLGGYGYDPVPQKEQV